MLSHCRCCHHDSLRSTMLCATHCQWWCLRWRDRRYGIVVVVIASSSSTTMVEVVEAMQQYPPRCLVGGNSVSRGSRWFLVVVVVVVDGSWWFVVQTISLAMPRRSRNEASAGWVSVQHNEHHNAHSVPTINPHRANPTAILYYKLPVLPITISRSRQLAVDERYDLALMMSSVFTSLQPPPAAVASSNPLHHAKCTASEDRSKRL